MRKQTVLFVLSAAAMMIVATGTASAFEGGGRMPSEAPLIEPGVHYSGQLNNHKSDANYVGNGTPAEVAFWRLPPVSTRDVVTVNWHALPFTHESAYPVCMILVQSVDNFSWGSTFEHRGSCYTNGPTYGLSGSGTAQDSITVQNSDSTATYLEFFSYASSTGSTSEETFPYDFSIEAPRHYLSLTLPAVKRVAPTGYIHASAVNAVGSPAPDGLGYTLTTTWGNGGVYVSTAASAGGQLTFALSLPESAFGQEAKFAVSRPADALFQSVASPSFEALVAKPKNPAESAACKKASAEAMALGRKHHRLQAHAQRARGRARQKLHHLAHRAGHDWNAAKEVAAADCT